MISPTALQEHGKEWIDLNPVGTGPFKFKSFVRDTSLEYERFDDYWGDKARVDGIKFIYITDATTAAMAFEAGDGLVWESADAKTSYDMVTNSGYKRETRRGPMYHLLPDSVHEDSPLSQLKVRQAIAHAINRQALVDALGFGTWEAIDQPNVPQQFGHIPDEEFYPYDPDKARQLLAEAGYPDGFAITLFTMTIFPQDPFVAIQSDLAKVGIEETIDVMSPPKWMETGLGGKYFSGFFVATFAATDFNYCAFFDRYTLPYSIFASPGLAFPEGWVESVETLLKNPNPEEYIPMSQELVREFMEYAVAIPLWANDEVYVMDPSVHEMGVGTHGDGFTWNTNKVWISQD
jgi:ABC-type transport system substrate-binding protein